MPYYVSRYVGTGTSRDPYRPAIWSSALASAIDLRPDGRKIAGVAFCHSDLNVSGAGFTKISDDKSERLSAQMNRLLYQELLAPEGAVGDSVQSTIRDLMVAPPQGMWKPLRRARGVLEIWLGGTLFWADGTPLPPLHGTINDDFNRANETPIASPWVEFAGSTGQVDLSSNAITKTGGNGDLLLYHNNSGNGWNDDQSSQFTYASAITDNDWGPAVRVGGDGGAFSGYLFMQASGSNGPSRILDPEGFASMETGYTVATVGQTAKIDVTGSTIRCYVNGVEDALSPATDTNIALAGSGAGAFYYNGSGSLDNAVLTGEVVVVPPLPSSYGKRFFMSGIRHR